MKQLIAKVPILFESRMYKIGEELPTKNPQMVDAWIEAGTAVWKDDDVPEVEPVKARPATAEPGLAGQALISESEAGENLVGKVPKNAARTKAPARSRTTANLKKK